jgi:hypothetical protein
MSVRVLLLTLATAAFAAAQSHPSWWTYASPDATALVGIQWENLRKSPLADAVAANLSSTGKLGFPDLDCLKQARQIVLSAPELLAIEVGAFPEAVLREQALGAGLRNIRYRNVPLWIPSPANSPRLDQMGVAQMSEQLVLVGARKTLEAAIDNSLAETGRRYSPLLTRAARFAQTADLWVVSTQLPDPLASLFVPIESEAQGFEGALRIWDDENAQGLDAQVWLDASSADAAAEIAERMRQRVPGAQVTLGAARVVVSLHLTREELNQALNASPQEPPREPPAVKITSVPAAPHVEAKPAVIAYVPAPVPTPTPAPVPQVIRIIGLDEGPKEIPFPDAPQPVQNKPL